MRSFESERYGKYISQVRNDVGVSRERLCEGLCSETMMRRFEQGDRLPDMLLRDRLLDRLGETLDTYEKYVNIDEYQEWQKRHCILESILDNRLREALRLLEEYRQGVDEKNLLQRQYILAMRGQIYRKQGASDEELLEIFQEAVKLTVPDIDEESIEEKRLSLQELNLILEYLYYKRPENLVQRYREVIDYSLQKSRNKVWLSRVITKAMYYLCLEMKKDSESENVLPEILDWCNQAVEVCREGANAYYLWEILNLRLDILKKLLCGENAIYNTEQRETWQKAEQETKDWQYMLQYLQEEFCVSMETTEYCYLYVEKNVHCIGDVIRSRRQMLDMTREQLCEGICSQKTMGRIERNQLKTQRPIVRELFERLRLPVEYQHPDIVTDNPRAKKLVDDLRKCFQNRLSKEAEAVLDELKNLLPSDVPINKQALMRFELLAGQQGKKIISAKEYIVRMKEVLECTVPFESVLTGSVFLTAEESGCILNMMNRMDWKHPDLSKCVSATMDYFKKFEEENCVGAYINMYEVMMATVASHLGNKGDYETADKIDKKIIVECMRTHRLISIPVVLYDKLWNYEQRIKEHISVERHRNVQIDLEWCILCSVFTKQRFREDRYRKQLEKRGYSSNLMSNPSSSLSV